VTYAGRLPARALLLDMDGTLVDSTGDVEKHWTMWAERRGLAPETVLHYAHGSPSRETVARFVDPADVAVETDWVESLSMDTAEERALPGALTAMTQTALPVAVVTSATRRSAQIRLRKAGLPQPAVLVAADDVERGKPDPEPYLRAAALLGVAAMECVGVEDSPAGVESMLAAGVSAIGVRTTFPAESLSAAVAVIDNLSRLKIGPDGVGWSTG
jgi:mannitol-1-/sugar-/sorbitol-6-phosphatase